MKLLSANLWPIIATLLSLMLLAMTSAAPKKAVPPFENPWRPGQFALLQALALPPVQIQTMPLDALTAFGQALFFDTQLNPHSDKGCVSCHQPSRAFSDGLAHPADNPLKRNSPSLLGAGSRRWQFWDGRADSLWSQALGPLFAAHEIALTPAQLMRTLDESPRYRSLYSQAFAPWPAALPPADSALAEDIQAHVGIALAAFVGELKPQYAPFDEYVHALSEGDLNKANTAMSGRAQSGLRVLLRSNCITCHRGAAFTDGQFHNIGTGDSDPGRAEGQRLWQASPFNCLSEIARRVDKACATAPRESAEISRLLHGAFKTPSLRGLRHTGPFMHDGRYETLMDVLAHYRSPPESDHGLPNMGAISDREAADIVEFLQALSGPVDAKAWYNLAPTHSGK